MNTHPSYLQNLVLLSFVRRASIHLQLQKSINMATTNKILFIGGSNIRNTFSARLKRLDATSGIKSEYVSATSFTAGCEALKDVSGATIVLICFLLNGISDAAELCANDVEIEAKISEVVDAYCTAIVASTLANPGIKHYVMPPYFRSSPEWLGAKLSSITDMIRKRLILHLDVHHVPSITFTATDLTDGVHLNVEAQERLYTHIVQFMFPEKMEVPRTSNKRPASSLNSGKSATFNTLVTDSPAKIKKTTSKPDEAIPAPAFTDPNMQSLYTLLSAQISNISTFTTDVNRRVDNIEESTEELEKRVDIHHGTMQIMVWQSACQAELTDSLINVNNHNQVIVSGLGKGGNIGEDGILMSLMDIAIDLVATTKVHTASITRVFTQKFPVPKDGVMSDFVVHFNCEEAGLMFRQQANQLRKDNAPKWKGVYVQNVVTKATRVRIFILQKIADSLKLLPAHTGKEIFVTKFESRPQLCFKKDQRITHRMYYAEALEKYEKVLTKDNIAHARKIAGRSFGDRLRVVFGIL